MMMMITMITIITTIILMQVGNTDGLLRVFRYPCVEEGAEEVFGTGHAGSVRGVAFSFDDSRLLSCGIQVCVGKRERERERGRGRWKGRGREGEGGRGRGKGRERERGGRGRGREREREEREREGGEGGEGEGRTTSGLKLRRLEAAVVRDAGVWRGEGARAGR
jgi:hypothetical protein